MSKTREKHKRGARGSTEEGDSVPKRANMAGVLPTGEPASRASQASHSASHASQASHNASHAYGVPLRPKSSSHKINKMKRV